MRYTMRSLVKTGLVFCLFCLAHIQSSAQVIYYHYDQAGNRTERSTHATPSARIHPDSTDLKEITKQEYQAILYPNASEGVFYISMKRRDGPVELYVFDIKGTIRFQHTYRQQLIRFDLTDEPSGMYIVKWRSREKSYIEKVLKH